MIFYNYLLTRLEVIENIPVFPLIKDSIANWVDQAFKRFDITTFASLTLTSTSLVVLGIFEVFVNHIDVNWFLCHWYEWK